MDTLRLFSVVWIASLPLCGQLPEFYKTVDRLTWVVEDLDRSVEGWMKLGFQNIEVRGSVELDVEYRGKPATAALRVASGRIGGVAVDFIQPLGGENAYADFQKRSGSGIFSLLHMIPTGEAFDKEMERMKGLGVGVLQSGTIDNGVSTVRYAYLDTATQGKYVLGLFTVSGSVDESPLAVPPGDPSGLTISQYAFVARDFDEVSKYWARLGLPALSVTHSPTTDRRYRGRPAEFDMKLGWQRHGKVTYEWILSLGGPNVYLDHLATHGEGVHHIAFNVDDMDKAVARWTGLGFPASQDGGWGEKGKPGSGRFSYHDTQPIGGIDVELLWSFR